MSTKVKENNKVLDDIKNIFLKEIQSVQEKVHEEIKDFFQSHSDKDSDFEESLPAKRSKKNNSRIQKKAKIEEKPQPKKKKIQSESSEEQNSSEADYHSLGFTSSSELSNEEEPVIEKIEEKINQVTKPDPASIQKILESVKTLMEELTSSETKISSVLDNLYSIFNNDIDANFLKIITDTNLGIILKEFSQKETNIELKDQYNKVKNIIREQFKAQINNKSVELDVVYKKLNEAINKKNEKEIFDIIKKLYDNLHIKIQENELKQAQKIMSLISSFKKDIKNEEIKRKAGALLEKWAKNIQV